MRLPPAGDQEEFYEQLLQVCRTDAERATCMLLWRTGMHASTLCSGSFVLTREYCIWNRPKTGIGMRAIVPEPELTLIRRVQYAGLLPATTRTLHRWVRAIGIRAGYGPICPLTLRHSRAIYLLDSGIQIHRVAGLLGCSYEVLEKHYAQIEAARLVL